MSQYFVEIFEEKLCKNYATNGVMVTDLISLILRECLILIEEMII